MKDFLKLVGAWGVGTAIVLGVPAVFLIVPSTPAGYLVVFSALALAGFVIGAAFVGFRKLLGGK